jgi:hypothetical protein
MSCCGKGRRGAGVAPRPSNLPSLNAGAAQKFALEKGQPAAELSLVERRIEICKKCVYFDAKEERCNRCTCLLVAKVGKSRESCPTGLW